ncbi:DUF1194 domain-containing protein [Microvirga lotononidis]|uniref:VWFA domain-containing protein n=1 Tax=Microvirga lotononidis TaxID=864069 RepID=I4YTY3_9HYPH|nr:DUF1194 domain-containing protein [Microvirga lotononidis]EIM27425.1 Protein of unknown function (DUF1194) [Microvirga lotononidis]WQO28414.1 DUF1194 domain-containing protein [Microvirga lotononidis]
MVRSGFIRLATGLACLLGLFAAPAQAQPDTEVDLALVIAVDISFSMDTDEQALQREGFAQAFRSKPVHDAIRGGMLGRIAVTYVEWAGSPDQKVIIPWTVLDNSESLMAFADRISSTPLRRAQRTSISSAIDFSVKLFDENGLNAARRVIDISGDGPNNQGRLVIEARDAAVAKGIIINGLPIMLRQPGYLDIPDLDIYYRDCVIGGQGAFTVPARERDQFIEAIKTKILLEVANLMPEQSLINRIQSPPRTNCMAGEMQWRDRWSN